MGVVDRPPKGKGRFSVGFVDRFSKSKGEFSQDLSIKVVEDADFVHKKMKTKARLCYNSTYL